MGMGMFRPSSCRASSCAPASVTVKVEMAKPAGDPNPAYFDFERIDQYGPHVIALLRYHGCTNFEGRKILLYAFTRLGEVATARELDPHFCESPTHLSPVARFEPTERGWLMAEAVAASLK